MLYLTFVFYIYLLTSVRNLSKSDTRNLSKADMKYEAEQNAGQAEYNRLHLHKERDRMMRIINAYKKLN